MQMFQHSNISQAIGIRMPNMYGGVTDLWQELIPQPFCPVTVTSYTGESHGDYNYGKDANNVFFQDSIIPGADAASFEKVDFPDGDSWTVFDRNRVYQGKDSPKLREYLKKKYGR